MHAVRRGDRDNSFLASEKGVLVRAPEPGVDNRAVPGASGAADERGPVPDGGGPQKRGSEGAEPAAGADNGGGGNGEEKRGEFGEHEEGESGALLVGVAD